VLVPQQRTQPRSRSRYASCLFSYSIARDGHCTTVGVNPRPTPLAQQVADWVQERCHRKATSRYNSPSEFVQKMPQSERACFDADRKPLVNSVTCGVGALSTHAVTGDSIHRPEMRTIVRRWLATRIRIGDRHRLGDWRRGPAVVASRRPLARPAFVSAAKACTRLGVHGLWPPIGRARESGSATAEACRSIGVLKRSVRAAGEALALSPRQPLSPRHMSVAIPMISRLSPRRTQASEHRHSLRIRSTAPMSQSDLDFDSCGSFAVNINARFASAGNLALT
jgi:hypothetical protein